MRLDCQPRPVESASLGVDFISLNTTALCFAAHLVNMTQLTLRTVAAAAVIPLGLLLPLLFSGIHGYVDVMEYDVDDGIPTAGGPIVTTKYGQVEGNRRIHNSESSKLIGLSTVHSLCKYPPL